MPKKVRRLRYMFTSYQVLCVNTNQHGYVCCVPHSTLLAFGPLDILPDDRPLSTIELIRTDTKARVEIVSKCTAFGVFICEYRLHAPTAPQKFVETTDVEKLSITTETACVMLRQNTACSFQTYQLTTTEPRYVVAMFKLSEQKSGGCQNAVDVVCMQTKEGLSIYGYALRAANSNSSSSSIMSNRVAVVPWMELRPLLQVCASLEDIVLPQFDWSFDVTDKKILYVTKLRDATAAHATTLYADLTPGHESSWRQLTAANTASSSVRAISSSSSNSNVVVGAKLGRPTQVTDGTIASKFVEMSAATRRFFWEDQALWYLFLRCEVPGSRIQLKYEEKISTFYLPVFHTACAADTMQTAAAPYTKNNKCFWRGLVFMDYSEDLASECCIAQIRHGSADHAPTCDLLKIERDAEASSRKRGRIVFGYSGFGKNPLPVDVPMRLYVLGTICTTQQIHVPGATRYLRHVLDAIQATQATKLGNLDGTIVCLPT